MPVITAAAPTAVAFSGLAATVASVIEADAPDPVQFYGEPALAIEPDPTPTVTPDAVRARVLDSSGAFVRHLPNAQGLRWLDEFNGAGAGSIDLLRYDEDVTTETLGTNLVSNPSGAGGSEAGWGDAGIVESVSSPGVSPPAATCLHVQSVDPTIYDLTLDSVTPGAGPRRVRVSMWAYFTSTGSHHSQINIYRGDSSNSLSGGAAESMYTDTVYPVDGWKYVETEFDTTLAHSYVRVRATAQVGAGETSDVYVTMMTVQEVTSSTTTTGIGDLDAGDQIMVSVGIRDIFRIILDAEAGYRVDPATGNRTDAWAGLGQLGVLNSGMVFPEYGWRPEATDERSFDYGSNSAIGGWFVPAEWGSPVGRLIRKSWRWLYRLRHLPKGWPDKRAQWLWFRDPDATGTADETCYFHSSFTLAATRRIKFWVCGDDTLEFQVDGEIRATTGPGGWKKPAIVVLNLSAGTHTVAAKVSNTAGTTGNANRSGFLCSIARMDGDGDVVEWVRRTTPSTWTIRRQRSGPPGWFAAQVLRQLVSEQKTRGCAGHAGVTIGFGVNTDSHAVPWVGRQEISVRVGTLALDYIQQLVETGIDVAMTPALVLQAWRQRGSDRSGYLRLDQHDATLLDESGSQVPGIRNTLYARARTGWVGQANATSVGDVGIRETMADVGSSRSRVQTAAMVGALLPDMAEPPQTVEVKVSGATGKWQPYRDFNVGDWVSFKPSEAVTWRRFRVMSIAGEVNEAGHPDWTLQLYED